MPKKSEFPIEVRSGSAVLKIYKTPCRGFDRFTLSYWVGKQRKRITFADLEAAKAEARRIVGQIGTGEFTESTLDREARASYSRALELLPAGVSLELAAAQFAEATKILGGRSIVEAVRYYARRHPAGLPRRTVSEAVEELITSKKADGLSYLAINDLKKLRNLAEDFNVQLSDLRGLAVDEWLRGRKYAPRTRNNYRDLVRTLFNFAKAKKYLPFDHDELAGITVVKEGVTEIDIYAPKEMELIFSYALDRDVPFLALAAFAGIRHWEITRLDWSDIKFDTGHVELKRGKSKTRFRRLVPIQDNLRRWLEPHAKKFGLICTYRNMNDALTLLTERIAENHKFEWKHNALRHSFISYRMALVKDENKVALESGNSPKVIFESYRELVSDSDAKAWFAIEPTAKDKIVSISKIA